MGNIFETLGRGRMMRISYTTELPVKAKYKKQGIRIVKEVETTVRTGVAYKNISKVIERRNSPDYVPPKPRENNSEWVIPNVLLKNNNTGKTYLYVAPMRKGNNLKALYKINTHENPLDVMKEYVIPSYFAEKDMPDVITICVDNIKKINGEIVCKKNPTMENDIIVLKEINK